MEKLDFNSDALKRRVYSLVGDDYLALKEAQVDSDASVLVKDEHGELIELPFRVTRNAHFGEEVWWIYGKILDIPDNKYFQLELKIHEGSPECNTAEAFPRAEPLQIPPVATIINRNNSPK